VRGEGSFSATVEVMGWVTRLVGGSGSGRREYEENFAPGETVRGLLKRISDCHHELDQALWDASKIELGQNIEVLVNDAVLGVTHTLDSPLKPGDRITLVGQYAGG
jgi:molybdopterin converting factor small subunit